jgi:uncharacterized repeat protein (TIGR01451 family)
MKKIVAILAVLCFQTMAFAQGWQRIFSEHVEVKSACKDYDGGYLLAGATSTETLIPPPYLLMKVDARGNLKWTKSFEDVKTSTGLGREINIIQAADSTFLLHGKTDYAAIYALKKLDARGNVLWTKKLPLQGVVLKSDRTGFTITGYNLRIDSVFVLKLNQNGETVSNKLLNIAAPYDFELQNNDLVCLKGYSDQVFKMNLNGQIVWTKTLNTLSLSFQSPMKMISTKDSSFYINGLDYNVLKISKNADSIWKKPLTQSQNVYSFFSLSNDDGLISFPANINNPTNTLSLSKFDKNGTKIWTRNYNYLKKVSIANVIRCENGGYLVVGNYDPDNYSSTTIGAILLIKMDENGIIYPNNLEGKVWKDINKDCQINGTDRAFGECIIEAKNNVGDTFWGLTDSLGRYAINIDSGTFTVKAYPLNNRNFWQSCTPSVSKTISSANRTDSLSFLLNTIVDCPAMDVHINTPILRRCFTNTYTVKYCNKGTVVANNAYITVTLDSLLEFINASRSITSQTGRTYRFNLGNVPTDDCGSFNITTRVRCGDSTRLGQTLCVEAKAYPDTVCPPPMLWSGANIVVTGACQGDSVLFQIKNTGTAPSATIKSIVIEDEVLFSIQPVQLPPNGVFTKKVPANGHTWRLVANQEPNHPISTNPTAFVEGCRANNSLPISSGFALLFPNDDQALTVDMACRPIVGAYDPNDKTGYPIGYKSAHYVAQNQDIEYTIRFQNTGTDTAFTVVIRDTISDKLDVSSIEFGSSSHVFTPEIYGKGILKFTFNNIKLVDSFKNEAQSHGFVQYRIKQKKDLTFGTQIFNTAHIYFDFNEPITTNKTLHTVGGKEVITAIFDNKTPSLLPIKVSPNPFSTSTFFEVSLSIKADFELYDITGKLLRKERFDGKIFEFQRKDLAAGIYIFKIMGKEGPLSIGKLIVE